MTERDEDVMAGFTIMDAHVARSWAPTLEAAERELQRILETGDWVYFQPYIVKDKPTKEKRG